MPVFLVESFVVSIVTRRTVAHPIIHTGLLISLIGCRCLISGIKLVLFAQPVRVLGGQIVITCRLQLILNLA